MLGFLIDIMGSIGPTDAIYPPTDHGLGSKGLKESDFLLRRGGHSTWGQLFPTRDIATNCGVVFI